MADSGRTTFSGSMINPVFFEVGGASASTTLAANTFLTYPLNATPSSNVGGGSWNATTFIYTVPKDGLYLCLGGIRSVDNMAVVRSVATGIGTALADGPQVIWGDMGNTVRNARHYSRMTQFVAGDQVRLFIYTSGQTFPTLAGGSGSFLSLTKVSD